MEFMKWHHIILSVFVLFNLSPSVQAAEAIGQVVWVKGTLIASQPNQANRNLTRRSSIFQADTLKTDATSTGQVVFTDNSLLALKENTILVIAQYAHKVGGPPQKEAFVANLAKGGFRTITGAVAKQNPKGYEANTPVATIGVSGTEFVIFYDPNSKKLDAKVDKGTINVANGSGSQTLHADCSNKTGGGENTVAAAVCYKSASVHHGSAPAGSNTTPETLTNIPSIQVVGYTATGGNLPPSGQNVGNFSINEPCN